MRKEEFEKIGFKMPKVLMNSYGVKIIIGTEGQEDWAVVIPEKLCKLKVSRYQGEYPYYCVSEERALSIAQEWTEFAKKNENVGGKTNG